MDRSPVDLLLEDPDGSSWVPTAPPDSPSAGRSRTPAGVTAPAPSPSTSAAEGTPSYASSSSSSSSSSSTAPSWGAMAGHGSGQELGILERYLLPFAKERTERSRVWSVAPSGGAMAGEGSGQELGFLKRFLMPFGRPADLMCAFEEQGFHSEALSPALTKTQIDCLPTKAFDLAHCGGKTACQICLTEYTEGEELCTLPCLQDYHGQCVDHWLQENTSCPICRWDVKMMFQ
ncbi:E3 ubiquitin-protein ligase RLIM-like [Amia ocellicauda]|uniref:E3 ubiquitin-protein ligase RLIM-like n=1 Tax=Amia ocellicauda TaxID=2972642 RepID=UPI00346477AE